MAIASAFRVPVVPVVPVVPGTVLAIDRRAVDESPAARRDSRKVLQRRARREVAERAIARSDARRCRLDPADSLASGNRAPREQPRALRRGVPWATIHVSRAVRSARGLWTERTHPPRS